MLRPGLVVAAVSTAIGAGCVLAQWAFVAFLASGAPSRSTICAASAGVLLPGRSVLAVAPAQSDRCDPADDAPESHDGLALSLRQPVPARLRLGPFSNVGRVDRERHWWGSGADPPSA
jgi:hypothetical protein